MREFNSRFTERIIPGLRREAKTPRNSKGLSFCQNMIPREGGLEAGGGIIQPLEVSGSWPFPQYILSAAGYMLATDQQLYSIGEDWKTLTEVPLALYSDPAYVYTPPSSNYPWHVADFGKSYLLFRPGSVLLKLNDTGMFGESQQVYGQSDITMQTGLAFQGRLVIGGFNPADFWPVDWDALLEYWTDQLPYEVDTTATLYENFVLWTQIGGGDILSLFRTDAAKSGPLKEDERGLADMEFIQRVRRNEWGFMPMPFRGTVWNLKQFGKAIVVYSEDGIALMQPVTQPFPTFGCQPLLDIGLYSRDAIGGDDKMQAFMDVNADLWLLTGEGPERLGYKEFLRDLDNPIISFDSSRKEFYISDQQQCFVLTQQGLGKSSQRPSCLFNLGQLCGTFEESAEDSILVTETTDFGIRDFKTITTIEVGLDAQTPVYVAVDYRYAKNEEFQRSNWVLLNPEGFARLQVSALEFRLCLRASAGSALLLDELNVRWQLSGKRTVRGIYGTAAGN